MCSIRVGSHWEVLQVVQNDLMEPCCDGWVEAISGLLHACKSGDSWVISYAGTELCLNEGHGDWAIMEPPVGHPARQAQVLHKLRLMFGSA